MSPTVKFQVHLLTLFKKESLAETFFNAHSWFYPTIMLHMYSISCICGLMQNTESNLNMKEHLFRRIIIARRDEKNATILNKQFAFKTICFEVYILCEAMNRQFFLLDAIKLMRKSNFWYWLHLMEWIYKKKDNCTSCFVIFILFLSWTNYCVHCVTNNRNHARLISILLSLILCSRN